jgi:hypothetical protein
VLLLSVRERVNEFFVCLFCFLFFDPMKALLRKQLCFFFFLFFNRAQKSTSQLFYVCCFKIERPKKSYFFFYCNVSPVVRVVEKDARCGGKGKCRCTKLRIVKRRHVSAHTGKGERSGVVFLFLVCVCVCVSVYYRFV